MTLTETLNSLLAASGLSAAEVARRADMGRYGPQQLQKILDGRNPNPKLKTLERIVAGMGGEVIIRPAELRTDRMLAAPAATGLEGKPSVTLPTQSYLCPSNGGVGEPCCDRAGEYNGYGSGPLAFRCPKGCSCHD